MAATHLDMHPYPTDLTPSVLMTVANALRGNLPDAQEAFHASWHIVGYFGGKWDVHPPLIGDAANVKQLTDAEAAAWLERAAIVQGSYGDDGSIPWALIIPLVMALIERLLPRK